MDSNTHSGQPPADALDDDLELLAAAAARIAARELGRLPDAARAERVKAFRRLLDGLEGQWLNELAGVDACGAAGAEAGQEYGSTAAWLRGRLRLGAGEASNAVRTARALFRGPLAATGQALCDGTLSPAHARVLAVGTKDLPDHVTAEAEPLLLETAAHLDPPQLRRAIGHLLLVADPDGADAKAERDHERRGLWLTPTFEGMVAVDGLLEAEAGQIVMAALEPLARPADAGDTRKGSQRNADALAELARRALEGGQLPKRGGVRPQLAVVVELDSLLHPGGLGGEAGWAAPLPPEACRRLACDGTVTRVMVSRHAGGQDQLPSHGQFQGYGHGQPLLSGQPLPGQGAGADAPLSTCGDPSRRDLGLEARLRAAMAGLPPTLGGAPSQPLDVGRATRVVSPAQRTALAVRDGGCVFPDCSRPLTWCEAHHLVSWLDGGATDLPNLALLCRAHHRAVHEGGWQLARGPDGRFTAIPPYRRPRRSPAHHRQPAMV
jgi:Domain of unknown function (DUF222)/HNH endonuclease